MIVNTSIPYNSSLLQSNINSLVYTYPFLRLSVIGRSVMGKPLYCLKLGTGTKEVFYFGAIHANEWITSTLLMKFVEDMCIAYITNSSVYGYNVRSLLNYVSFYIVPMANPDGVDLVNDNIDYNSSYYISAKSIADAYSSIPFPIRMES